MIGVDSKGRNTSRTRVIGRAKCAPSPEQIVIVNAGIAGVCRVGYLQNMQRGVLYFLQRTYLFVRRGGELRARSAQHIGRTSSSRWPSLTFESSRGMDVIY